MIYYDFIIQMFIKK